MYVCLCLYYCIGECVDMCVSIVCQVLISLSSPASGTRQLLANPPVAGPRLSPSYLTRKAVSVMGSDDLVVGKDHL